MRGTGLVDRNAGIKKCRTRRTPGDVFRCESNARCAQLYGLIEEALHPIALVIGLNVSGDIRATIFAMHRRKGVEIDNTYENDRRTAEIVTIDDLCERRIDFAIPRRKEFRRHKAFSRRATYVAQRGQPADIAAFKFAVVGCKDGQATPLKRA